MIGVTKFIEIGGIRMVKNKLVRNAVAVVVALGVIGTIPVFAESYDMEDGHAYNNATSSGHKVLRCRNY